MRIWRRRNRVEARRRRRNMIRVNRRRRIRELMGMAEAKSREEMRRMRRDTVLGVRYRLRGGSKCVIDRRGRRIWKRNERLVLMRTVGIHMR